MTVSTAQEASQFVHHPRCERADRSRRWIAIEPIHVDLAHARSLHGAHKRRKCAVVPAVVETVAWSVTRRVKVPREHFRADSCSRAAGAADHSRELDKKDISFSSFSLVLVPSLS